MNRGLKKNRIFYCGIICLFIAAAFFPPNSFARPFLRFHVVKAGTNTTLQAISCYHQQTIHIREYGNALNIIASLWDYGDDGRAVQLSMSDVARVTFEITGLDDDYRHAYTDKSEPFAAYGDNNGIYKSWNIPPPPWNSFKSFVLSGQAYDSAGNYIAGSTTECFTLYAKENNYAWIDFILYYETENSPYFGVREMNIDGAGSASGIPFSQAINIQAVISDQSRKNVTSVKFFVDGTVATNDKSSPYTIIDEGYILWPFPGTHELKAIGYNANNQAIAERTLKVHIENIYIPAF